MKFLMFPYHRAGPEETKKRREKRKRRRQTNGSLTSGISTPLQTNSQRSAVNRGKIKDGIR